MLRSLFGPSKEEIWSQLALEINGQFEDGGWFGRDALRVQSGEWEIVLDTYTVSHGNSSSTYTRMRAPFVNTDGLYFNIYREGFFSAIGKMFNMQDIEIGDSYFDEAFIIKGNDENKIRRLLADETLKSLIQAQQEIGFKVKNDEGIFGSHFPDGVDQLYFSCHGTLKDLDRLKNLFDLFTRTLERLVQIDSAYEDDPGVRL